MSQGYGVDSDGNIRRVWLRHLPGAAGAAFGDLIIRVPATGKREVSVSHALWTWNATTEEADPPVAVAEVVVPGAAATEALHAFLDQADEWEIGLVVYGGTIEVFGKGALSAGRQGAIDYAQDTSYSLAIRERGLRNLAMGASDITSPQVLARQIDQFSQIPNQDPLTKIVWVDRATGERITLQAAVAAKWGMLNPNFKAYTRPDVTA